MTFHRLWENIQASKESPQDDRGMSAIRTGIGIRKDFWDDFLEVINNSDGLSELLDIPSFKIAEWHNKVKEALDKVKKMDGDPETSKNKKLLKTGHSDEPDPHSIITSEII